VNYLENGYIMNRGKISKDEIIRAAAKVFMEKGYSAGKIEDVAKELGLLKGSIYYYVRNKEDLLHVVIEKPIRELTGILEEISSREDEPINKIKQIVHAHLMVLEDNYYATNVLFHEKWPKDNKKYTEVLTLIKRHEDILYKLIKEGSEKGQISSEIDPKVLMYSIIGVCNYVHRWYSPKGRFDMETISDNIINFVINGITERK
jgi:TetR/AcrR family transcriptional regulator, cholesterol catabolism regulator